MAGGDITKYDDIYNTPYNDIFVKLMMNKETAAFQRRYAKVIEKESK